MKNLFKTMMLVAVAAMGFTACSNEAVEEVNPAVESKTYTMTFVADAPNTRTSVSIDDNKATYSWSESGEYLKFFQYTENKESFFQQKSNEGAVVGNTATFVVSFGNNTQVEGIDTYYYSAIYPESNVTDKGSVEAVKVKIPNEQTLTANSFDPKSDLMVAKPIFAEYNSEEIHELQFTRLAAVGCMNIKGLSADEKILQINLTFEEGTNFVGAASVNLENSTLTNGNGNNTLTLNANGEYLTSAEGTPVFFTCFPGEYSGAYTIEIETDEANYINTGKSILAENALTFSAGDVLRFNISAGVRTEKQEEAPTWVKISSLSELAEGDRVALVGTVGGTNYSLKTNSTSKAPSAVDITITDGAIAETSINSITTFYIGKDGSNYILYEDEAQKSWLYCTDTNNGVRSGNNTNKTWTIASHSNNGSNFEFKHISTKRFLGIYNKQDWRCYDSVSATNFTNGNGTSDIAIYKLSNGEGGGETPDPTPDPEPEPEPDPTPDPGTGEDIAITLDFKTNIFDLRTSSGNDASSEITKTYNGYSYLLKATNSCYWFQSKALFLGKANSYVTFPAIEGYKLASVKATSNTEASDKTTFVICNTANTTAITGGTSSTITKGGSKTWTLTDTEANTSYRLYITNGYNAQLTKIELTYVAN